MIFNKGAKYYDSFLHQKGKKAEKEVEEILDIINGNTNIHNVLDLCCGTGRHSIILSHNYGYNVTGIDKSKEMINIAQEKKKSLMRNSVIINKSRTLYEPSYKPTVKFLVDDIINFNLKTKFDLAICLFESFGYITKEKDIKKALKNINAHLKPEGLFILSFINGEKTFKDSIPIIKRTIKSGNNYIERNSISSFNRDTNIVSIKQSFLGEIDDITEKFIEIHEMKYFFIDELTELLKKHKFKVLEIKNDKKSWATTIICKKVKK